MGQKVAEYPEGVNSEGGRTQGEIGAGQAAILACAGSLSERYAALDSESSARPFSMAASIPALVRWATSATSSLTLDA